MDRLSPDAKYNQDNWPPQEKGKDLAGAGILGMWLFIVALAVSFGSVMAGYLFIRVDQDAWLPLGSDGLPASLWLSTALIVMISAGAEWSRFAVRKDQKKQLRLAAWLSLIASLLFTVCQVYAWSQMIGEFGADHSKMIGGNRAFPATFYLLTGLHVFHVLGGIVYQVVVLRGVRANRYWSYHYPAIRYSAMYWHFLGVVWIALFGLLSWGANAQF